MAVHENKYPEENETVYMLQPARFKRYKPSSAQFKIGVVGRWQVFNGYGWVNVDCDEFEWIRKEDLQ